MKLINSMLMRHHAVRGLLACLELIIVSDPLILPTVNNVISTGVWGRCLLTCVLRKVRLIIAFYRLFLLFFCGLLQFKPVHSHCSVTKVGIMLEWNYFSDASRCISKPKFLGDMTAKLMYDYQLSTCPQNWRYAHFPFYLINHHQILNPYLLWLLCH